MYLRSIFLNKNKKNITNFHLIITIFTGVKNGSILHGRVSLIIVFFSGTEFLIKKCASIEFNY